MTIVPRVVTVTFHRAKAKKPGECVTTLIAFRTCACRSSSSDETHESRLGLEADHYELTITHQEFVYNDGWFYGTFSVSLRNSVMCDWRGSSPFGK